MKIGCHVSGLQAKRAAPYDEGVENAVRLGFDAIELIAMSVEELDYYTADKCRELRERCDGGALEVSQFALFSPACQGLVSADASRRSTALDDVRRGIEVAANLGSPLFNLVAHWPDGIETPHAYPPSYIHPVSRGLTSWPSSKLAISMPDGWNFDAEWDRYLTTLDIIGRFAGERGLKLAVEGHANVLVSGADAMLRMFDRIGGDNVVVNLDTAWHLVQRELLPMSILKLKDHIGHVHLRDGDGLLNYILPVGEGIIDWRGVFETLRSIDYDGVVSFEYTGYRDYLGVAAASKAYIEAILETTPA